VCSCRACDRCEVCGRTADDHNGPHCFEPADHLEQRLKTAIDAVFGKWGSHIYLDNPQLARLLAEQLRDV
jgi:hypothetical protein